MSPDNGPQLSVAAPANGAETPGPPRLRRVLGLGDLVFYGLVLIQPVGAVGIFGLADQKSFGHVTLTIFIALAAMMLTAWSYGRMAGLYPAAGSAYTYVGRGLHPHFGFIAGWCMFLDYLVIPIVSVIYGAISIQKVVDALAPGLTHQAVGALGLPFNEQRVAFVVWVILFVGLTTFLNVRGIQWTAHANQILTAVMFLVIAIFVVEAVQYLWLKQGWAGLLSTKPFYNPHTFDLRAVGTATSLAALTYIGFDGITTLAEDVKDPKRTVPLAVVLVCLLIGICVGLQVYLAQRAWPDYTTFKDPDTAFFDVCSLVGGKFLLNAMATDPGGGLPGQRADGAGRRGANPVRHGPRQCAAEVLCPAQPAQQPGPEHLADRRPDLDRRALVGLRKGGHLDQLRRFPGLHGREPGRHPGILLPPARRAQAQLAVGPRGARGGLRVLPLDLGQPAHRRRKSSAASGACSAWSIPRSRPAVSAPSPS